MRIKLIERKMIKLLLFLILCSLIAVSTIFAQEEEENFKPKPIPTADILKETEKTSTTLQELSTELNSQEIILDIEEKFPEFLKIIEEFQKDPDMQKLDKLSAGKLSDLKKKWMSFLTTIKRWEENIVTRLEILEKNRINLLSTKRTWEVTYTTADSEKVPNQMLNRIDEIIKIIGDVQTNYRERLNEIISLQNIVSDKINLIKTNITQIDESLAKIQVEIFIIDSKPLWKAFQAVEEEAEISDHFIENFKRNYETLAEFYEDYKNNIVIHFVLFITLLAFLLSLRRFGNKLIMDKEAAEISREILNHPYSVALLVTLLLTSNLYPQASNLISKLAQIMSLVPVIRLLPVLYVNRIYQILLTFIGIYFLNLVYVLSSQQVLIHRVFLLFITLLSLLFLIWIIRQKWLESIESDSRLAKFGSFIIILFSIFLSISIFSNLIGNVSLAHLLTTASLTSIYASFILLTGSLVVIGLLNLILSTKFAYFLRIVRVYPQKIRKNISKFIYFIASLVWIYITMRDFTILDLVYDWFDGITSERLQIGSVDISLGDVLVFFLAIYMSILISRFIRFILEEDVLVRMQLPRGVPAAISMLTNYAIIGLGLLIALSLAGFELNKFAIVLGALGVGIGFGLQNIVNNFISGLILIFERPIQLNDTIAQGSLYGTVSRIGIRSSTIRTFDGAEVIVPNANLISNEVTNWTLSDRRRRIQILVGVAYGTDPEKVLKILNETIKNRGDISDTPEPMILFREFGESSLNFDLRFWTSDSSTWMELQSSVNVEINNAFKKAGIEIPFPQRDLHLRSVDKKVVGEVTKKQTGPKEKSSENDSKGV
jgi:small-conductance mechanosensitive channel